MKKQSFQESVDTYTEAIKFDTGNVLIRLLVAVMMAFCNCIEIVVRQ
jgi:hypothetical protein